MNNYIAKDILNGKINAADSVQMTAACRMGAVALGKIEIIEDLMAHYDPSVSDGDKLYQFNEILEEIKDTLFF